MWILEALVANKTYGFEYETEKEALLDLDTILYPPPGAWVHIQNAYFKKEDVRMVSLREVTS